jgi:hypothetical protein
MHFNLLKRLALAGTIAAAASVAVVAGPAVTMASSSTFVVEVDTVATGTCVETNTFERGGGNAIVWRIAVLKNGQEDKSAKVELKVKGGATFKASWDKSGFWTVAWFLPMNAPTGIVNYTVTATDGNLSATYSPPWLVQPSELTIAPYTYGVAVSVGKVGASIPVRADVTYAATTSSGKATTDPMTSGNVTAEVALQGNVNAKGQLNAVKTVSLHYSGGAWTGSIPVSGLKAGLYVVQVHAADHYSPPNTGSGTSLAFSVK